MTTRNSQEGFTLVELMVVVAIVGILSAIAIPSYSDYVIRSRITHATSELAARRVMMEQFFQDNHFYGDATTAPPTVGRGCLNDNSNAFFNFACPAILTPTTYTVVATGKGTMAGFNYTINEANVRTSDLAGAPAGWAGGIAELLDYQQGRCVLKTLRGFSLVELMVGIAVFSLLLALAAPSFAAWMRNGRIRTAAESVQTGLQLARSEAVRRNTSVRFQFTTSLDNTCSLNVAGPHWVISLDDATGNCASAASDTALPRIIQSHNGAEGSGNSTLLVAGQDSLFFNGMGRRGAAASVTIDITDGAGVCLANGGTVRCLRIVVSNAGQIRMCDLALPPTDTQSC